MPPRLLKKGVRAEGVEPTPLQSPISEPENNMAEGAPVLTITGRLQYDNPAMFSVGERMDDGASYRIRRVSSREYGLTPEATGAGGGAGGGTSWWHEAYGLDVGVIGVGSSGGGGGAGIIPIEYTTESFRGVDYSELEQRLAALLTSEEHATPVERFENILRACVGQERTLANPRPQTYTSTIDPNATDEYDDAPFGLPENEFGGSPLLGDLRAETSRRVLEKRSGPVSFPKTDLRLRQPDRGPRPPGQSITSVVAGLLQTGRIPPATGRGR